MNDLNLDFRSLKGHTHSNQFLFSVISFSRRNSKTTRDRRIVPSEENIRNFVFCRMAPSIMTSGDIECQNCFLFLLVLRVRFAQKYASDLRRYFCSFYCFLSSMIVELKSSTSRFYCDFVRVQQKRKNYAQVSATSSNVFTNYL